MKQNNQAAAKTKPRMLLPEIKPFMDLANVPPIANGSVLIQPKGPAGPRLKLEPLFDRIFVSDPDADAPEQLIYVGQAPRPVGYAVIEVLETGKATEGITRGDKILVAKADVQKISHEQQNYFWCPLGAIQGIVRS